MNPMTGVIICCKRFGPHGKSEYKNELLLCMEVWGLTWTVWHLLRWQMLMLNLTPTLTLPRILTLPWTQRDMITLALTLCHRRYHRKSNCRWSKCRITLIPSVTTDLDDNDVGRVQKGANHAPKAVSDCDSDPFPIWKPDFTLCECKALSNQAYEMGKMGTLDRDPPRKPDSEDLWTQSSFGTWFVRVRFGNAHWSHAWVNQRSRNKILPHSAQIPQFVIGMAVASLWLMHVVQITNPIRKRTVIWDGFQNVIHSFVNRPITSTTLILPTVNTLIRRRGHYNTWKLSTSLFLVRIEMLRLMNKNEC